MENPSLIAIIPARGGSKRLPRKNILPFFGHPMLAYTVTAALSSQLFRKVVVSTDDSLTGSIARWYGAEWLHRPRELATDKADLVQVGLHLLDVLDREGINADFLCQLMPNCPLRRSEDIANHYRVFKDNERSFQISAVDYRGVYPHWSLKINEEGKGDWVFGSKYLVRSQNLGQVYCPTGAIWWVSVDDFKKQKAFYGNPFYVALIDANRGIDIDRADELDLAEILVRGIWQRDGVSPLEPIVKESFIQDNSNDNS